MDHQDLPPNPNTDPDLDYLLDLFTGADGGIGFINLRSLIEVLKKQADEGDKSAAEVIKIFRNFTRLAKTAQDPKYRRGGAA